MKRFHRTQKVVTGFFCLAALGTFCLDTVAAPKITISNDGIEDDRDARDKASYMRVYIKARGDIIKQSTALRTTVTRAVDDTGHSVLASALNVPFGAFLGQFDTVDGSDREGNGVSIKLLMQSPPRRATMLSQVVGELEFYLPNNDPQSVITKDLRSQAGKAIVSPTLKAAGLSITVWTKEEYDKFKKESAAKNVDSVLISGVENLLKQTFNQPANANSVILRIDDPHMRLAKIGFEDAKSKMIEKSSSVMGNAQGGDYEFDFKKKLPPDTRIKVYVATPKSIVKVPFELKNLPLP